MSDNAEIETQGIRGTEGSGDPRPDHSNRETGPGSYGPIDGGISSGAARKAGEGSGIAGGILTRLIQDTLDRQNEARECIEWYQREFQRQSQRLEDLRALQESADQEPNT